MSKPIIIAYYLPQFHPTPDNDRWWGRGFTEWTNVGKAKSLFKGHYQPKVPADLGYYDLRIPEIREAQASMAKAAGVDAFCYYHYWFGNGKEELELPFNEVLNSGKPDFPFCLCWANESWHSKFWRADGKIDKTMLIEQTYPGDEDIDRHFYRLLPAFKDSRYFKIDGKNVFVVYKPFASTEISKKLDRWRELSQKNNIPDFLFIAVMQDSFNKENIDLLLQMGFDKVNLIELFDASLRYSLKRGYGFFRRIRDIYNRRVRKLPYIERYKHIYPFFFSDLDLLEECCPTVIPNWDHSPRSGRNGFIITDCTPELFREHLKDVKRILDKKNNDIVFLKSWNEWGEGNYVEPDIKFGHAWLDALKDEFCD